MLVTKTGKMLGKYHKHIKHRKVLQKCTLTIRNQIYCSYCRYYMSVRCVRPTICNKQWTMNTLSPLVR